MISYKKANREYYEYYECTATTSGQAITANRQTNGQASTTSRQTGTANGETSSSTNGQASTTQDQTNSASTMSDKISSAIITILY